MKKKNITLINPFVWENFFYRQDFASVDEMETEFAEFVEANKETIDKINEMIETENYMAIKEEFGYDVEAELVNEAILGKRKTVASEPQHRTSAEDDFAEDGPSSMTKVKTTPKPSGKQMTADDIEAEQTSKNVTTVHRQRPALRNVDLKIVRNVDFDSHSMADIHFCVQTIYEKLCKSKDSDGVRGNYKAVTPLSLLDTEAVDEMDALFAFMDLPNVDLRKWDTSNVTNMEGMFYKSTFNNDSIKDWDVSKVNNMRNMFIGSDMTNPEYISNWYPNTLNHALPKLGVDSTDELDDDTAVDKIFGSEEEIKQKYRQRMSYQTDSYRVMTSDEFIAEGRFAEYIKRGVEKIKSAFSTISITLKNGITWVFDKMGEMLNVVTPETTEAAINSGIAGVSTTDKWQGETGYYERIEKGSQEYNNYLAFLDYAPEGGVNEARVTMSANRSKADGAPAPNIDADDWNSRQLTEYIKKEVTLTQRDPGRAKSTLVVWGAPGIGKSSIPKTLIRVMNETEGRTAESEKMTVLVADCSQMTADGFALPTPAKQMEIAKLIKSTEAARIIADQNNMSEEELNSIDYKVSSDAPKTWLPVYKPTGDPKKDEVLNALANGCVQPKYNKAGTKVEGYEKTGSGGIILIDEFLRANSNVFFVVCQLMYEYRFGEYVLGDKWQILAASNRPSDDSEVRKKYASAAGAGFNRLRRCNFVPSFDEWTSWAKDHGFDETTLTFISGKPVDGKDSRWHNFDPELKNSQNNPSFASPRSWSDAIAALQDECSYAGYTRYGEMPKSKFREIVGMCLPADLATEYTDYYYWTDGSANPYTYDKIVDNPKLNVKNKSQYKCANAAGVIIATVRLRFDKNNRIPVRDFEAIMEFFCNNYPDNSNVIYTELYQKIIDICGISAPEENATPEEIEIENSYDSVGDIFAKAFPEFVKNL